VRIRWLPSAVASARRFMSDQSGMHAIGVAVAALAAEPYPSEAFHRGEYHRLRVGEYRVTYFVADDVVTVQRVDRVG
jgi:mRNA-degrading endonuclease RelE of RelBE toxin-antitoxin system